MAESELAAIVTSGTASAVAVDIEVSNLKLFAVPEAFVDTIRGQVPFHCVGGRCRAEEDYHEAMEREVREEVNRKLQFLPVGKTALIRALCEPETVRLKEQPCPFLILERAGEQDPSFFHPDVYWVIGYRGKINTHNLVPHREVLALLLLSRKLLALARVGLLSLREICSATDGSMLIARPGTSLDLELRAVATGIALYV